MRAALLAAVREPFVVEDIDYLDPAPGRVLVRTGASPFCSTDCVNWRGELFKIPPTILGHASMGEVVRARRRRRPHQGRRPCDRAGHLGVRRVLLLLDRPPRSMLGDVRPRRDLAARGQPPERRAGERGRQRRRLRRGDERHRQSGVPGADRPARRVAEPAGLRHHHRRRLRAQRRQGAGRLQHRDLRARAPRTVDGAVGPDRRRPADHRGRPDRRTPRAGRSLRRDAHRRPRGRRSGRAGQGAHAGARRRLHDGGGDAGVGGRPRRSVRLDAPGPWC